MAKKKPNPSVSPAAPNGETEPSRPGDRDPPSSAETLAGEAIAPRADHESIGERIKNLTPEQAEMFVRILEITMKRRRIMLLGYLSALFAFVIGMGWALYRYGVHEPGTFIGWVFLVPVAVVGALLWSFGRWAKWIE